jgi:hypothetical protein
MRCVMESCCTTYSTTLDGKMSNQDWKMCLDSACRNDRHPREKEHEVLDKDDARENPKMSVDFTDGS